MKINLVTVTTALSVALSGCAVNYSIQPMASSAQTIRYNRGSPTVLDDRKQGSIQVVPVGVSQNRMVFDVAVFNKGSTSANFGVEDIHSVNAEHLALKTYTKDELASEAQAQARARLILAVIAGAATAYAAQQNAYSTTNGYVATPRGVATFSATTYNPTAAALGTAAAGAATGYTISRIEDNLDDTMAHLNGAILQTTTVDAGQSYGGEVVVDLPKAKDWPQKISLQTSWNGEAYDFDFQIAQMK